MPDARKTAFIALTGVLAFGTAYSVLYNTYLDTSNPLLTNLAHPLSKSHYFANKANILNTLFIKRAWGWTSGAFMLLHLTSASDPTAHPDAGLERMYKWLAETASWLVFTSWFFGPAVLERVIAYSGGECILALPDGSNLPVPNEYCFSKAALSPATHPSLFASPLLGLGLDSVWKAVPRLRRGHDISGHVFLLTMSILFLADQLRSSFRRGAPAWSAVHKVAVAVNVALIGIWLLAMYTTSVYFHTAFEKFTGYLLGLACFAITQTAVFDEARVDEAAEVPAGSHQKEE
ncbi:hypothetical protein FIBSPDRAFT_915558 [Athelia psychrophila]|uniref:Inositol phospholipid synthesis and fat-storage-inducing TM-domain-containing protein n=1 Tax=Athelia psychrophila TaxID=1759441 RepID=A0A166WWT7_9AGAM|nr:hypothetical protein FIBSPDRAFT_915558 [Fibularhizoctonia sp. CBS 109695]